MGFQGAHQGSRFSFGSQVRIHLEKGGGSNAIKLRRQPRGPRGCLAANEDDVHIGDIVELSCATLAHCHDCQLCIQGVITVDGAHSAGKGGG